MILYKLAVLGDCGVGKSALIRQLCNIYGATFQRDLSINAIIEDQPCVVEVLSTSGIEEYIGLRDHILEILSKNLESWNLDNEWIQSGKDQELSDDYVPLVLRIPDRLLMIRNRVMTMNQQYVELERQYVELEQQYVELGQDFIWLRCRDTINNTMDLNNQNM
ncbi:6336_t:CDS:2 [Entrophospora sp. SA101]|nr:21048_t:CDS:2 [Entrophospora sp. SA101]CAJ0914377.1 6336_t:CDS:2 [Entrophospora sp. SA101]